MSDQFIGVKPVEERHRIDAGRLEDFLKREVEGFRDPLGIEQFKGGQSNPTYRLSAGGRRYVLRRKPPGKLLPSAHAVDREFKVIRALHSVGFPVAKPYVLCEDDSVIGTAFYLMDCVEGRVLWDQALPGMSRDGRRAIWEELNRVMALLHGVDYKAVGLADFGKAGSYIERQVGRWTKQYLASETVKIEAMDRLIAWLPKNIPATDETTIVHGDYRLDNAIFHPTEPKVLAVLDWELATLGNAWADVAYMCLAHHLPPVLAAMSLTQPLAAGQGAAVHCMVALLAVSVTGRVFGKCSAA
jgi:aminoglycoside phosphotransferase (APT) family kinase protein